MNLRKLKNESVLRKILSKKDFEKIKIKKFYSGDVLNAAYRHKETFVILKGFCCLSHKSDIKDVFFRYCFGKGDIFGDSIEGNPYTNSWEFEALTDTYVLVLPQEDVELWKKENIQFLRLLYLNSIKISQLSYVYLQIMNEKGADAALAYSLAFFGEKGKFLTKNMSKLAMLLGVSRPTLYSSIKKFEDLGFIKKISNKRIDIIDEKGLVSYCNLDI